MPDLNVSLFHSAFCPLTLPVKSADIHSHMFHISTASKLRWIKICFTCHCQFALVRVLSGDTKLIIAERTKLSNWLITSSATFEIVSSFFSAETAGEEMTAEETIHQALSIIMDAWSNGCLKDEILSGGLSLHQTISMQSQTISMQSQTNSDNQMRDNQTILHQR